jgi:hypothetical protein
MGVKNKPIDLHNHLFEQLERLNDDELTGDELNREIGRAQAMCGVAMQIISNRNQILDAVKTLDRVPGASKSLLMLE